jgi:hypothetical protein
MNRLGYRTESCYSQGCRKFLEEHNNRDSER